MVLGGFLYDFQDFETLKDEICPEMSEFRKLSGLSEIKSNDLMGKHKNKQFVYGALLTLLRNNNKIRTFYYIIDKLNAYRIKEFDQNSFKYNFSLRGLYYNLVNKGYIGRTEDVKILLDEITLSKKEKKNIEYWLPGKVKNIKLVKMDRSIKYDFIQIADIIAGCGIKPKPNQQSLSHNNRFNYLNIDYVDIFPWASWRDIK